MVNKREIISPPLLLYHHHHLSPFFLSSFFSLIPIIFPNFASSLLTLIPFSSIDSLFRPPFSLPFFNRFFPPFLFPNFCSFSSFSIWVSLVSFVGLWVGRLERGVAVSSPGVLK
ncbi:hypothetical protein SDJN03_12720, partial [Cucurbita argyrosperma subsp. sororia]